MSNIFGSQQPSGDKPQLAFGGSGTTSKDETASKPLFGATPSASNLFGNLGQNSGSSGGFGALSKDTASSSPFGSAGGQGGSSTGWSFGGAKANENKPSESPSFGSFLTPSKPASGTEPSQPSNLFGNPTSNNNTSDASGAATPPTTAKPQSLFGNLSTTPAGPPPSASSGLFNLGQVNKSGPSLFGAPSGGETQNKTSNSSPSLFGNQAQQSSNTQPTTTGGLFGSTNNQGGTGSGLFGGQSSSNSGSALFGKPASDNKVQDSTTTSAKPSPFAFPTLGNQISGNNSATPSTSIADSSKTTDQAAAQSPFSFPKSAPPIAQSSAQGPPPLSTPSMFGKPPDSAPKPLANMFPGFNQVAQGKNAPDSTPAQTPSLFGSRNSDNNPPTTKTAGGGLFANLGEKKDSAQSSAPVSNLFGSTAQKRDASDSGTKQQDAATSAAGTAAPSSSAATAPTPLFGSAPKPANAASFALFGGAAKTGEASTGTDQTTTAAPSTNTSALGASTSGPAPSVQSRLKNKSMDEIITRWASDLSKYQKEFQAQAEKVASWDRMLLENGNSISKLYSKTFQAERDTAEVQKQLTAVENNQDELSVWLDKYEREVDEMMARQVGQGEGLQGPDQERERTYKIAERVSERLGEMGKDLTTVIEEINEASTAISKTSKADDPLSQIVRVLNGHLSQLQVIDQSTSALQAKVTAAAKESQRLGSRQQGVLGNDATDDFYRSYMSRH